MDVETAFLKEELDEDIYMDQPIVFEVKRQEHKVCKLKHSTHGFKESSR